MSIIAKMMEDLAESYCKNCGEPIVLDVEWIHCWEGSKANNLDREYCLVGHPLAGVAEPIEEGLMMVLEEGQV